MKFSSETGGEDKVNILIVDDRPENLIALKAILQPLGQNIVEAKSGREALKWVLDEEFAVILLDVMMPEMDGFETAKLIRERQKSRTIPILFVTAMLTAESNAFQGYEVGAVDYIMKPFIPEILRAKVQVFIELFQKNLEVQRQAEKILAIEQREYENKLKETRDHMERETERVRAEQQIAQSVVQHSPMGILRLGPNMTIAEANATFCEQFNFDSQESSGKLLVDALPWLPEQIIEAIQHSQGLCVADYKVAETSIPAEKSYKYWDFTTWPVRDADDKLTGTILVVSDVTERVLLEEQRKDFIGTLAHDLQTPVIASDRVLELLLKRLADQLEPDMLKLVSGLKQNNQNLLRMIQSLLELYQYEAGAIPFYFDHLDLDQLVVTCVEELKPLAERYERTISTQFDDKEHLVWADRTAFRRVVTNLIDNAIKYSHSGGKILVSVSKSNSNEVVLQVSNSGSGIAAQDKQRIFERFWHGVGVSSYKASSGLGLYLCKQIVDAHKGHISFQSEAGKNTTFSVQLPTSKTAVVTGEQLEPVSSA